MAQNQDDGQEKSLDPTPQRLEKAREQGDIAKSMDVATFASYIGFLLALVISGGAMAYGFAAPLSTFLSAPHLMVDKLLASGGSAIMLHIIGASLLAIAPLWIAPMIGSLLALVAQRAFVVAPSKLEPKISRLSLIENAGQKFGPTGLVEFLKSVVKLVLIAIVLVWIFLDGHDGVAMWMGLDGRALPSLLLEEAILMISAATVIVGLIAAADYLWQQHDLIRRNRMSQQDAKDEAKTTEGDPYMKASRREKGRKIAMGQMMQDVKSADVVVVNPTHYAVALKWERAPGAAPVCVAKGLDHIALRIREIADANDVPIHSDPPTARALHAVLEVGDEVQPEHYEAVAVAIRFADTIREKAKKRSQWSDRSDGGGAA